MYKIKIEIYDSVTKCVTLSTFEEAIAVCNLLAETLAKNWTRHPSITGIVRHTDKLFDLYNEGSITIGMDD